jgi:HEAT repeat protein
VRRRERRRAALLARLLAWLEGGTADEAAATLLVKHRRTATGLLIEIFELMRGADQERLAHLANLAGIPDYLRRTLARGGADERLRAAESLVWFPSPDSLDALRAALRDRRDEVSLAAAASLAELGETVPVAGILETRLGRSGDSSRRLEALLVRVAPRQGGDLMRIAQDSAGAPRVRAAALDALARTGSFDLLETIAGLNDDPAPLVRAAVARGLGVFGHPAGEAAITRLLDDPDWEVRAEAAEAAGRIGLEGLIATLARLLADEIWWVRFRAGEALAGLGSAGIAALRQTASAPFDAPRRMAALVLAERGLDALADAAGGMPTGGLAAQQGRP